MIFCATPTSGAKRCCARSFHLPQSKESSSRRKRLAVCRVASSLVPALSNNPVKKLLHRLIIPPQASLDRGKIGFTSLPFHLIKDHQSATSCSQWPFEHTSAAHQQFSVCRAGRADDTRAIVQASLAQIPLLAKPGQKFRLPYNDAGDFTAARQPSPSCSGLFTTVDTGCISSRPAGNG